MSSIERGPIVAKFGGSSLADAERVKRVGEIVQQDPMRRFVVVSAPGKVNGEDEKVTDLLLACHTLAEAEQGSDFNKAFEQVSSRYEQIGRGLAIHSSVVGWLDSVRKGIQNGNGMDWTVSRGEWLMANTFASFMGGSFADAARLIRLQQNGQVDPITYQLIAEQLNGNNTLYVIPGFYGAENRKKYWLFGPRAIKVFARGGSDITGAIVARGVHARVYETWKDVDGLKAADPRIVAHSKTIPHITYAEMREMGYRGADVLQRDTVRPVYEVGIPIYIRNASQASHPGTLITRERVIAPHESVIGIAGKEGFVSFQIDKFGMNEELGIAGKVLEIFQKHGVPFEHDPTGLDAMSVIVSEEHLNGKRDAIMHDLQAYVQPDRTSIIEGLGLVCVVGEGIARNKKATEVIDMLAATLRDAGIDIKTMSYRTAGSSIVIGVDNKDVCLAIKSLYNMFIR